MTTLQEDLDLEVLWFEQVACDIDHTVTQCSGPVIARVTYTCADPAHACASATRYVLEGIAFDDLCECDTPCKLCWSVRPI